MRKGKIGIVMGVMVVLLLASSLTTLAATSYKTPLEAAAGVTGKSVEDILEERSTSGKTCAQIAEDAGKLEEFQKAIQEMVDSGEFICGKNHIDCPNPGTGAGCIYNQDNTSSTTNNYGHGHGRGHGNGHGHGRQGRGCVR